jgi:hypothetical protein
MIIHIGPFLILFLLFVRVRSHGQELAGLVEDVVEKPGASYNDRAALPRQAGRAGGKTHFEGREARTADLLSLA